MNILSLRGIKGGVGTTTLVANLAAAMRRMGRTVIVVDLCNDNLLRLLFSMPFADTAGWAPRLLAGDCALEAGYRSETGIHLLPFGRIDRQGLDRLNAMINQDPHWLAAMLQPIDLPADSWLLLDCPVQNSALTQQAEALADQRLQVINAEPGCYALLAQQDVMITHNPAAAPNRLLINAFNPQRELDRNLHDLMRLENSDSLAPVVIHQDETLREAFACMQTATDLAPQCQAVQDLQILATWLFAQVVRKHRAA